ncbi:MAG: hypothetical protein ACLR4Z_12145 [Butyricicoccaceae bacterium]
MLARAIVSRSVLSSSSAYSSYSRRSFRSARASAVRQFCSSSAGADGGPGCAASRAKVWRSRCASTSCAMMPRFGQFSSWTRCGLDLSRE